MMIHVSPYPDPVVPDALLGDYIFEHAARRSGRRALVDGESGAVTTYGELIELIGAGAAGLTATGIAPGDVVALVSHNQPAWAVAFHAVVAAGGVVTPINPTFTAEEMTRQLRLSRARAVIAASAVAEKARSAASTAGVRDVFVLGDMTGFPSFERDVSVSAARPPRLGLDPARALAVLPYSSGTTGVPKGVMLTHRNIVANIEQHVPSCPVGADDVFCAALPFFHIYGMTIILNAALRGGGCVVTMPRFDLGRLVGIVRDHHVTKLHLAPPIVLALASSAPLDGEDFSSLRAVISGAAPLDADVADRAEARLGIKIGQGYGMTEASPGVLYVPEDRIRDAPRGSVGVLIAGTEARVVDPATGTDTDGAGELWIRGPQVMAGYLAAPEETKTAITRDGWLRTGDLVRVDGDGWWWLVDRLKELIKYKGYQVAPAEIEALLLTHPDVEDAAVAGVPDREAGEVPHAWIVRSRPVEADELMGWVSERVAPYKKLRAIHFVDTLPRSPAGKLLRRDLQSRVTRGS